MVAFPIPVRLSPPEPRVPGVSTRACAWDLTALLIVLWRLGQSRVAPARPPRPGWLPACG